VLETFRQAEAGARGRQRSELDPFLVEVIDMLAIVEVEIWIFPGASTIEFGVWTSPRFCGLLDDPLALDEFPLHQEAFFRTVLR
jgi:hypothetical protein